MDKKSKKWLLGVIITSVILLLLIAVFVIVVDPYFHYHKPLSVFRYTLDNERYQNNGIVKNFDYNAIITGSSMTENFKPSELDSLYGLNTIKVPFSGGSYREVNELLECAFAHNDSIKMVVRGLDYNRLFNTADHRDYQEYPDYLYDENLLNDVSYLFNADVIMAAVQDVIGRNANGMIELDFDMYASWETFYPFGKNAVDNQYARNTVTPAEVQKGITEEEYETIRQNVEKNIISLVKAHPDVDFYYYFTPYSIAYIDYFRLLGELERQLQAEKFIIEMLMPYENLHLYSFYLESDIIENMDNYRDVAHHSQRVNSLILQHMKDGVGLLTPENYEEYCEKEREYFYGFDYDAFFADWD